MSGIAKPLFPVHPSDRELERGCEEYPQEIWDVREGDPAGVGPDGQHRPDKSAEDEQDVSGSQKIVFETELDRRESEIENKIQNEWQKDSK